MKKQKKVYQKKQKPKYVEKYKDETHRTNYTKQENYQDEKYPKDESKYREQEKKTYQVDKNNRGRNEYKEDVAHSSKNFKKQGDHFINNKSQRFYSKKQEIRDTNDRYQKNQTYQTYKHNQKDLEPKRNYNKAKPTYRKIQQQENHKEQTKVQQNNKFPQSRKTYRERDYSQKQIKQKSHTQYRVQAKQVQTSIQIQRKTNQHKKQKTETEEIYDARKQNKYSKIDREANQDEREQQSRNRVRQKTSIYQQEDYKYSKENQQNPIHFQHKYEQHNKIELQAIGLDDKVKKIKKIFLQQHPKIRQLKIYASKDHPTLYFQYYQPNKSKKTQKHIAQVLRQSKNIKQKRSLFQQIFERAFLKVDKKYYNISVFLIELAKVRNVNITKRSIFNLDEGHDVMFYYMKGKQNKINFIVFDCFMRNIHVSCKDIEDLSRKHPDEYLSFLNFKKKVFEHEQQGQVVDLLDNQQAESDEDQRPNFQEKSIQELKGQLYKIIDKKDIEEIQQNLQKMNNELFQLAQIDTNSTKYKIMQEKIEDLQSGYDMFINTRDTFLDLLPKNLNSKEFHKKYLKKMIIAEKQLESGLPIIGKKRIILEMLKKKNLLIIEGETGSGKSTQLPQILCEFYQLFDNPQAKPVLVTQPRRLATRSLAQRVAKQMGEVVGGFVDYVASAGKQVSKDAKIIFKMDRIVLDQLTQDTVLSKYSCLVIDEAHQRTISIDVILGLIKKLLIQRKDFKIIVTSASMDIQLFQNYFKTKTLKVSGRMHPVTIIHKDIKNFYEGDKFQNVKKIQKIINEQILSASGDSIRNQYKGHLLCFCSQIEEITKLVEIYDKKLNKRMFQVFALHGKITPGQQKKVFEELGKHKIIFANRIAETAITIDGVKVVIDPGNDVQLVYDQKYKYSSMKLQEITKSSAKQRAGRAGRTGPGYCFRLYSQTNFNNRPINKVPQIQNSSLETVVLRLKTLKIQDVINFEYISPPNKEGLQASLRLLTLIGALKPKSEEVTKIGSLLIKIPIEPFLSRAIVQSLMIEKLMKSWVSFRYIKLPPQEKDLLYQRGLTKTIISILALVINFSNLFFVKKEEREEGEKNKFYEFSDQEGDFFFLQNIFLKFIKLKQQGNNRFQKDNNYKNKQLATWIRNNFLNFKALNQTEDLIKEIGTIISDFDFKADKYEDQLDKVKDKLKQCKTYREVVLSCLITSFSANICKFSRNSHLGYTMVSQRKPLRLYGTSNLQLLGKQPQWIVCHDLYTNETGRLYCKLAHEVSYQFMKTHLDKFVWQLFDIQGIQRKSPFYKQIVYQFPTLFINKFKQDYNKSQKSQRFAFLKDSYPEIIEQKGKITFFLQLGDVDKRNKRIQNQFQEALQIYQVSIINQSMNQYRHNYIGNVYVTLFDGFKIEKIQFDNREFLLQIIGPSAIIQQMASDCQQYGQFTVEQTDFNKKLRSNKSQGLVNYQDKQKLKLTIFSLAQKDYFEKYFLIMRSHGYHLQYKQTIVDKRRKIPKTIIYMYFFAGKASKNMLYAHYDLGSQDVYKARDMADFIKQGIIKATFKPKLKSTEVQVTRAGNGINMYTSYDEYEIAQELFRMDKAGLFGTFFKMPRFIKKFRQPDISQASKTNDKWKAQLNVLFEKSKIKSQNITINIRGTYRPEKTKGPLSEFEKSFRVDMTAQIITLDSLVLQKLKHDYDGKKDIIGCQKVHVRAKYEQIMATASYKAFYSLEEQFEREVERFKFQFPLLIFETIVRMIRGQQKVMIYAHSPNRQDFVKPLRIISSMFTPKLVKLAESEFRFLDMVKDGALILDRIQEKYNYKIYFGFDRWTTTLKVYCHDDEIKDIENIIKQQIAKYKYFCEKISYRGKNLNRVKQILDNYHKNNPNTMMTYEIKFQFREVLVTGDFTTVEFIKNQILKLVNSEKEECIICADIMKTPYKLILCGCSFCCMCLTQHIRAYRNSSGTDLLRCPKDDCNKQLNIYDVKNLLSEQQFNKMCDVRINKYLQSNKQKFISCNYCQNVFDRQEVEEAGEINCQICGKCECLKCKSSHPNYTCEEWKNKDSLNLQKLGIKKCPQCGTGITKNGGCNHMECTSCKAHICWKCLKLFPTSKSCYDHLAKQCGGIFDADAAN